jgi:flagellar FliJ protein
LVSYKFSLEKVLEWRAEIEKRIAKSFAIVQNELNYQEITLNNLRLENESIKKKILELNNINDLKQQYLFKQSVEQKIKEILKLIEQTKTKLEKLRLDLLEAQKNRKIMEKLKEKDYIEYKENLMLEEQKELDEIAVFRYGAAGEM